MPYKIKKEYLAYQKGYYAGYRRATLDHLGKKCVKCGSKFNLEIDHIEPLNRKARSLADLEDLSNLQILCRNCNSNRGFKGGKT